MSAESKIVNVEFIRRLHKLGIPLLKLWGTDTISGAVVCRCRNKWFGKTCQPGKHLVSTLLRSVITSEEDLLAWIAGGGNVGLSLGFTKPGAPPSPLRLIAFDDDDGTGRAWLAEHGITSPWVVRGKRGFHVYAILADGVPDFITAYNYFKPMTPKMDVKTSGLMVLPLDNGKTLEVDGQEITSDSSHLLDRFSSLEGVNNWVPHLDPRVSFPKLKVRNQEIAMLEPSPCDGDQSVCTTEARPAAPRRCSKRLVNPIKLFSNARPDGNSYRQNYRGIPYYERRRFAKEHIKKVHPSISGKNPFAKLVKAVNDCIHGYGMSDQTTWEIIRDYFNPRCKHPDGSSYPWRKGDVANVIKSAHEDGRYTTLDFMKDKGKMANPDRVLLRLKKKGQAANERRGNKRAQHRQETVNAITEALFRLGFFERVASYDVLMPKAALGDGSTTFKGLYDLIEDMLTQQHEKIPSTKMLGFFLGNLGLETDAGLVKWKSFKNALH